MPDVNQYILLQYKRQALKERYAALLGRDLSSLMRDAEREINSIINAKGSNPLTLTTADFKELISGFVTDLNKDALNNYKLSTGALTSLNNDIKEALDFNYPVDYQVLPFERQDDALLIRQTGALLNSYRDGKIEESTLRRQLRSRLHAPVSVVNTVINTQTAAFDNTASQTIASLAGLEKAVYFGSIHTNTRPFCRHLFENLRPYTEREIRELNNGQKLNVLTYCGGYNCTHQWLWGSEDWTEIKQLLKAA